MAKYHEQLERVRRFLDRVRRDERETVDYDDDLWAFFQNAWHLKDWIANDMTISEDRRDGIVHAAHSSESIQICADLANRSKHLKLTSKWKDADVTGKNVTIFVGDDRPSEHTHTITLDDGTQRVAQEVAEEAVAAWEIILAKEGLK